MTLKTTFENLTDESKILAATSPIFASTTANPDEETEEQLVSTQEKFLLLPEHVKDKLASLEISKKIQEVGKIFNLQLLQLINITRAIRSYYFGELKLEDMPFVLAKEMNVDLTKAKEISNIVINKIINDNTQEKKYQAELENLTIPRAIESYPEVGEQLITSDRIKIKSFPEPVRPSLKNWLADYTFLLGREKHSTIERGNYLFQSENGKNLPALDRQRMAFVLKCFDENIPITVNKTNKQIIFPQISENTFSEMKKNVEQAIEPKNNIQSIQFSYPQKTASPNYQKMHVSPPVVIPKQENKNELGPNVVNLKE